MATTKDWGIGKDGKLPWKIPTDIKFFNDVTRTTLDPGKRNAVIMGRKTWESITPEFRPLSGRLNVVLTRSGSFDIATVENVVICGSLASALELLAASPYRLSIEKVFVIGGGQILRESLNAAGCDAIHITEIETNIDCDTFMPAIDFSEPVLREKGIHIWNGNASREFLDSIGLNGREEGDLGPVYGFSGDILVLGWYTDMHADYTGQGFDQLSDVIDKIKNNPNDRRIILSAWNPSDLKLMALPTCHMFAQFYVANGELSCQCISAHVTWAWVAI
ncbi:Bifunctional dihydrofolate reductase-thymidylate synthase [Hibiscus syriacus]|uniref:dihydrofolate reductase n=1 Tax=Hibiscus syriacus TaxID=106335 RepID=A0A6A3BP67_HIBSY|nr:Bifunctional dihydrofolate reductase-thymidylate synthase [Hibiscus syriacus]